MKYFIDTEFCEDFTHPWIGKSRHYIDLISIAIVSEDGREFYAVSNEFDIDHVWNKYQMKQLSGDARNLYPEGVKEYWLRDNVLMPIFYELQDLEVDRKWSPALSRFKALIKKHGKSNKQIAEEIVKFVMPWRDDVRVYGMNFSQYKKAFGSPEFYGYYSAYDHVLLCSLYGRMLDLPSGFPMYTIDLKQTLDEKGRTYVRIPEEDRGDYKCWTPIKSHPNYPQQTNEHNALADARWNKKLYDFIQSL